MSPQRRLKILILSTLLHYGVRYKCTTKYGNALPIAANRPHKINLLAIKRTPYLE